MSGAAVSPKVTYSQVIILIGGSANDGSLNCVRENGCDRQMDKHTSRQKDRQATRQEDSMTH